MRRSKIKATVCVGRRKPDTSRKAKENVEANDESVLSNETPHAVEFKAEPKSQTEDIISSVCPITAVKPIPQASPLVVPELPSDPISSVDSIPSTTSSDPTLPSTSNIDPVIPESPHENSSPPATRTLISRSKIRAVPKFRNRKTGSSAILSETKEVKSDTIKTTTEAHVLDTPSVEESTSNSPANASSTVKTIPQVDSIPPTSPTKICRSKIKAVPALGNRKTFSSASDSEDGSKRISSSRTRTESQSSSVSGIQNTTVEQPPTHKKYESCSDLKRKFRKSEGSKKLAEARREFAKKYVDGKPDYKRLTMMDLIFYNPTTNPMRYEKKKSDLTVETPNTDKQTEEDVDNPEENRDDLSKENDEQINKSDDEDDIIAPRIKIGPTGEIILDEKSLVIENKKAKKAQEAIEKSAAIDGDLDRPYGVYKRSKRSKDWTHSETLKFYRALSTVGTDFSLMNELFPNRTRRELKIKFKREEKTNQALVDQAIMKPCNFNYEELKTEFEMMDIEILEIEQQQMKAQELKKKKQYKKSAKFLKITQDNNSTDNIQDGDVANSKEVESVNEGPVKKRRRKPKPPKKLDILSALSDSDPSDEDSTDSEGAFVWQPTQTTRYGRKTKRREIYEPNIDPDQELIIQKKIRKPNPEPEHTQEPGSLMMISSETPDGQSVVKIFMVTDDKSKNGNENEINPQNLLPIAMIRTGHTDDEAEEEVVENNYTIPADTGDTVENLRKQNVEETHNDLAHNKEILDESES